MTAPAVVPARRGRPPRPRPEYGFVPLCMDAGEWSEWREANDRLHISGRSERPCTDCPMGYAAEMRAQGRCNGTPGGVQDDEEDEEMDQRTDERTAIPGPDPRPAGQPVDVAATLPCEGCLHAEVCRIRPGLERLARLTVIVPRVDAAIGVTLDAAVTCSLRMVPKKSRKPYQISDEVREQRRQSAIRMNAEKGAKRAGASA